MTCALCDDTGWKTIEANGVSRVARCECMRESAAARLLAEARIPRRYQHCDLTNYIAYNERLTKALAAQFQKDGLLEVAQKHVRILDIAAIERVISAK